MSTDERQPDLSGKTALVTGGSRGIGLAIASALVASGANVVISGRNQSHLDEACALITAGSTGDRVHAARADVSNAAEAVAVVTAAVENFGGVDILINNAGIGIF